MKKLIPMLTIKKLVAALEAIALESSRTKPEIGVIEVIATGTLADTKEEIATIADEAMKYGI
jgi:hypothetical protein